MNGGQECAGLKGVMLRDRRLSNHPRMHAYPPTGDSHHARAVGSLDGSRAGHALGCRGPFDDIRALDVGLEAAGPRIRSHDLQGENAVSRLQSEEVVRETARDPLAATNVAEVVLEGDVTQEACSHDHAEKRAIEHA